MWATQSEIETGGGQIVQITHADFPEGVTSMTKDGVTITADWIMASNRAIYGPGITFKTELGNFTRIEVTTMTATLSGDGWETVAPGQVVWTGNASSVSTDGGYIHGDEQDVLIVCVIGSAGGSTPEPEEPEGVDITPAVDPQHPTYYYSTFFDSSVKYELPAGVNAYLAKISDDALTLTKIADAGDVLPNNVAVIFRSTVANFTLTPSTGEAVTYNAADNSLQGTDVSMATPANCYVLSDEDNVISFYQYSASNLNAHKAYVIYTGSQSVAPRRMPFIFNEEQTATGMEERESNVENRKVIENGQLVIIRDGVRYNAFGQVVE